LFSEQSLPSLSVNTPAKPMTASADTLKLCGFFLLALNSFGRHEALH
jgi:hypothetical protein